MFTLRRAWHRVRCSHPLIARFRSRMQLGTLAANAVERYTAEASDEEWITLMGSLNRSQDPGATCLKRAFEHALRG